MQKLTAEDMAYYRGSFEAVDSEVPYRYQQDFLKEQVRRRLERGPLHNDIETSSTTITPVQRPKKSIDASAATVSVVRTESLAGLQDMFSGMIGAFLPEGSKGFAAKFIEELVDQVSDKIFEEEIQPGAENAFDRGAAKMRPWIAEVLTTTPDRSNIAPGTAFHLDLASLREEVKASEHELLLKEEERTAAEQRRVEKIREPVEHVVE